MWIFRFLLGFTFFGVLLAGPEREFVECMNVATEMLMNISNSPDLKIICPILIEALDCIQDVLKKYTGVCISEIARTAPPGSVLDRRATFFKNSRIFLNDACTEGTPLNTALTEQIECMADVIAYIQCQTEARLYYEAYKRLEGYEDDDNKECMNTVYTSACLAAKIRKKCGQRTFDTFVEIVKRSSIFSNALCVQDDLEEFETEFLYSLDMESSKKDLLRLAFDRMGRRK